MNVYVKGDPGGNPMDFEVWDADTGKKITGCLGMTISVRDPMTGGQATAALEFLDPKVPNQSFVRHANLYPAPKPKPAVGINVPLFTFELQRDRNPSAQQTEIALVAHTMLEQSDGTLRRHMGFKVDLRMDDAAYSIDPDKLYRECVARLCHIFADSLSEMILGETGPKLRMGSDIVTEKGFMHGTASRGTVRSGGPVANPVPHPNCRSIPMPKQKCPECNDTGELLLLNNVVPCSKGCKKP